MPINIIDVLKPKNNGNFPVVEDVDLLGGFRVVSDLTERDAIASGKKKAGMVVRIANTGDYYQWSGSDWEDWRIDAGNL